MGKVRKILVGETEIDVFRCPVCREKLTPVDLEAYPCCPYCNAQLTRDGEIEDFILGPMTKAWVHQQNASR